MPFDQADNEHLLLQQVANDDEAAFRRLFNHYHPVLYHSAYRLTKDRSMAEDILQETFLKVWLKRSTLTGITNFGGWLFTIYENLMFNSIKRIAREQKGNTVLEKDLIWQINLPDYPVERKEIEQIIVRAIERLPEKQRLTYQLIREQGMTRIQAAGALNVAPETVKTNLDNALRAIRAYCLKEFEYFPFAISLAILSKLFF